MKRDPNAARFEMQEGDVYLVQSVAKFVDILKYDPNEPRNPKGSPLGGQWVKASIAEGGIGGEKWVQNARQFTSEEGYQWHEKGPVAEWAKNFPYQYSRALDSYSGFGYREVNDFLRGNPPTNESNIRTMTKEEVEAVKTARHNDRTDPVPPEGGPHRYKYDTKYMPKGVPFTLENLDKHAWVVMGPVVDPNRSAIVAKEAATLNEGIANHGYALPEAITVERGAYLPGVGFEQLQNMAYEGPHGEPPAVYEEKGFTSTMVGDAGGRAKSYPALGKWESLHQRYPNQQVVEHQDEVGTAVRFHIALPAGTKVASVESVRRMRYDFPKKPITDRPVPADVEPKYWVESDFSQKPEVRAKDLDAGKEGNRTESEVLLGSGAKFQVTKVLPGYTYSTGDPKLHPVQVREVYLEYIGGGSSDGRK